MNPQREPGHGPFSRAAGCAADGTIWSNNNQCSFFTGDDQFGPFQLCNSPKECADKLGVESDTLEITGVSCQEDTDCEVFPGSVCLSNQCNRPFSLPALDAQVVQATANAILRVARGVPLNVTIDATDEPADDGDALQFIDYLEATSPVGAAPRSPSLPGGTPVCWDVNPVAQNTTVEPKSTPQLFKAKLTVSGDGSPLDERSVFFLVPPAPAEINVPK